MLWKPPELFHFPLIVIVSPYDSVFVGVCVRVYVCVCVCVCVFVCVCVE